MQSTPLQPALSTRSKSRGLRSEEKKLFEDPCRAGLLPVPFILGRPTKEGIERVKGQKSGEGRVFLPFLPIFPLVIQAIGLELGQGETWVEVGWQT